MAGARRVGGHKDDSLGGLMPAFVVTAGNIMSPVEAFQGGITSNFPSPSARGYNKAPGDATFPLKSGTGAKTNPLKAFGMGGKD